MSARAFHLPNDLLSIDWDAKLYSLIHSLHTAAAFTLCPPPFPLTSDAMSTWRSCSLEVNVTVSQGCSLGLERLGLEAVSRHFLEVSSRLGLEG